jgi:chorismate lyase/3-hydroxybenzoate synthase
MAPPPEAQASSSSLYVAFGGSRSSDESQDHELRINVPCLGGTAHEIVFPSATRGSVEDGLTLYHSGRFLLGHATVGWSGSEDLAGQTQRLYERILSAGQGRHLYRMWNYVPRINEVADGLENYRSFCKGRSLAFETAFGRGFQQKLPAASAVGSDDAVLDVIFVAGEMQPQHIENPEQVPAYHYPMEYGPRSPSFSRATMVSDSRSAWIYISGTAAIKGHTTVAPGSLSEQIDCTLDNLRLISRSCAIGDDLGAGAGWNRYFKVYLRNAADYPAAARALEGKLIRAEDRVAYLRADVCRAALNIEIEATLRRG